MRLIVLAAIAALALGRWSNDVATNDLSITSQIRTIGSYENSSQFGGAPQLIDNKWSFLYEKGHATYPADSYVRRQVTLNGTSVTYNLEDGTLTDDYNASVAFSTIKKISIINLTETTGYALTIQGDWYTNTFGGSWSLPEGGGFHVESPVTGFAVVATSADQLTIDSGVNVVSFDLEIVGVKQ